MSKDEPFSNREIQSMFEHITYKLEAIEQQTIKTNGRVSRLETFRTLIKGMTVALSTMVVTGWTVFTYVFK